MPSTRSRALKPSVSLWGALAWQAVGLLIVALIGVFDFSTGREIRIGVMYLVPVAIVTWYATPAFGLFTAFVGAAVWLGAEIFFAPPFEQAWIPYFNASVRLVLFVSGAVGLATLKKTKQHLEEKVDAVRGSEARFRAVAESANDAVVTADESGQIVYWNQSAQDIFGYSEAEIRGQPIATLMLDRYREAHVQGFQRYLATGEAHVIGKTVELAGRRKDGGEFPVELSLATWRDSGGTFFTAWIRDITERTEAAEVLAVQSRELARSNAELEQFAYVASHDLQEPLRMVTSYCQLLDKRYGGQLDGEAHEFLDFAVDEALRMQALINDLLAFSRVGRQDRPKQEVDLRLAAAQATRHLDGVIRERGAELDVGPLPTVTADSTQMVQLFQNLVGNALKYSEAPPRVAIAAEQQNGNWVLSVHDNGIGIAPEHQGRIFQIFQRLHNRDQYSGTGIGLAMCKKIVEYHGGRIWVESQEGQGSTFYFTIPATGDAP